MNYSLNDGSEVLDTRKTLSSDRLQKLIDKNRKKQEKRDASVPPLPIGHNDSFKLNYSKKILKEKKTVIIPFIKNSLSRFKLIKINKNKVNHRIKRRSLKLSSKTEKLVLKLVWFFCFFLVFKLLVGRGGVLEYQDKQAEYKESVKFEQSLIDGNKKLIGEIKSIKKNRSYQKRLVRDHLGFIHKKEYIIVFSGK